MQKNSNYSDSEQEYKEGEEESDYTPESSSGSSMKYSTKPSRVIQTRGKKGKRSNTEMECNGLPFGQLVKKMHREFQDFEDDFKEECIENLKAIQYIDDASISMGQKLVQTYNKFKGLKGRKQQMKQDLEDELKKRPENHQEVAGLFKQVNFFVKELDEGDEWLANFHNKPKVMEDNSQEDNNILKL